MSVMTEYRTRTEDVGEILVKVQEDLHQLKSKLLSNGDGQGNEYDLSALENAINKTEEGIRCHTDQVLEQLNNQVLTLPSLDAVHRADGYQAEPAVGVDSRVSTRGVTVTRGPVMETTAVLKKVSPKKIGGGEIQMAGPSPGQFMRQIQQLRVLSDPHNPRHRDTVQQSHGIQLPLISQRKTVKLSQAPVKGSTVEPLAVLPHANRRDPQILPPPITEEDAKKGILSLLQRGLIPPAADLSLDPSPVYHCSAPLHDPEERDQLRQETSGMGFIKMDHVVVPVVPKSADSSKYSSPSPDTKSRASSCSGFHHQQSAGKVKTPVTVKTLEMPFHPMPPPTTPASAPDFKDKGHRFAIQHARIRDSSQDFIAFKQHYCLSWGSIVSMLRHLENMCLNFAVPIAFIHGDKLADLSLEFELEKPPTLQDLLTVVVNREDVENIIMRPGRRFVGTNGKHQAACKIQATYRMHQERQRYLEFRKKKWAAGIIAISWVMHVKMSKVRNQLKATRLDQIEVFRHRSKVFGNTWSRLKSSKRVIIHIPSLGYSQNLRSTLDEGFSIAQNMQMGRLCDIKDENVDVIYISPVALNEEMLQYYSKLLGLKAAINTGNVDDQTNLTERYQIIVPDAIKSFPSHRMCLSTVLKYSPKTLKRIRHLIRGRNAYIVTGVPHSDDLYVADYLDVPLLSGEPEVAQLYSTKSGSKRIFASANVAVPPGEYDIYNIQQLHECLAQLITENLDVSRWLFKLDDEFDGRGIAYCDVADNLPCYNWALKEANRYGEKWHKKWAQEAAYMKIHGEVPDMLNNCATPLNTSVYPTWEKFLEAFLSKGGVVEACPPSDSVTALTVNMLIEPDGRISMVCMGDQIHAETPFTCWGLSVPQSSVEPEQLNATANKVAEACKARGIIGYFAVDFVTFIHPKHMTQELWAVDLNLWYDSSLALYSLMEFSTQGTLDTNTHFFDIPPPRKEDKKSRRRKRPEDEQPPNTSRYAVMSTKLHHTNLSVVHYSVFFQMCRAHGIGYDIKEKQGSMFTLCDGQTREDLGMITIGDSLQGALATFARNLSVIHQEISAPNMQGESNFKPVIEDIEAILGTTVQNAEDEQDGSVSGSGC